MDFKYFMIFFCKKSVSRIAKNGRKTDELEIFVGRGRGVLETISWRYIVS